MIGAIHAELFVYSEMQCEDLCLRSANCSGYELETKEGDSKKKCHLISNKHETLLLRVSNSLSININFTLFVTSVIIAICLFVWLSSEEKHHNVGHRIQII